MVPFIVLIGLLWYLSRRPAAATGNLPQPSPLPPKTDAGPVLTGRELARLPDGTMQPLAEPPQEGQPAPFPPGTVVDVPSMEPLFAGYCVGPDGTWQKNARPLLTTPELTMMQTGGGWITLPDGRVVPL